MVDPWEATADGVRLLCRVQPKAGRNAIVAVEPQADDRSRLKIAVTAVPDKGRANAAVIALLAKKMHIAKRSFEVLSGATSRNKVIGIAGETDDLLNRLKTLIAAVE